jgi:hypothetical protein
VLSRRRGNWGVLRCYTRLACTRNCKAIFIGNVLDGSPSMGPEKWRSTNTGSPKFKKVGACAGRCAQADFCVRRLIFLHSLQGRIVPVSGTFPSRRLAISVQHL